jgi:hypothetical protein
VQQKAASEQPVIPRGMVSWSVAFRDGKINFSSTASLLECRMSQLELETPASISSDI